MNVTPTSIKWYYYDGDSWEDISGYVLTAPGVSGSWGMGTGNYTDRLARSGEMRMTVDNREGKFDPDDADVLTGWAINTKVKMEIVYDGVTYRRFYGTVKSIRFNEPSANEMTAQVTVADWMSNAYTARLRDMSIETFRTADWAVDAIVDEIGVAPLATKYSTGCYEFDAVFDSMTDKTTAATELNKIVLSEDGYLYVKHDKVNGETLVFENDTDRSGLRTQSVLPVLNASCGFIEKEGDTDNILQEDGTSKIILDTTQLATISGYAVGYGRSHGDNIINKVTVTAYPKRVDTSVAVLYSLGTPIQIAAGETKVIHARYQNASTKESCTAITDLMIAPVATTDYTMNDKKAGTGTDKTAYLSVTADFKSTEVVFTLVSTSTVSNWITKLQCRGYGVYMDSSINYTAEDTTSQTAYGLSELTINQMYQRDTIMGQQLADQILFTEKDPRTKLNAVTMIANKSDLFMQSWLNIDVGDMVRVTESTLGLDDYFYVQGVEFNIMEGNIIAFKWVLSELEYTSYVAGGITAVTIESDASDDSVVDFGYLHSLYSYDVTVIMSIYPTAIGLNSTLFDCSSSDSRGGYSLGIRDSVEDPPQLIFTEVKTSYGRWYSDGTTTAMSVNNWYRVAVKYSLSDYSNPIFYINGTAQGKTVIDAPGGAFDYSGYGNTVIGGYKGITGAYSVYADVKIKNVKVYNRLLSAAEITADAAGTHISNGLVFWGPFAPTKALTDYYDASLTTSQKLIDAVTGKVGTPQNAPVCREIT